MPRRTALCVLWWAVACGGTSDENALRSDDPTGSGGIEGDLDAGADPAAGGSGESGQGGSAGSMSSGGTGDGRCDSDRDCTPLGKLCDLAAATCVDCTRDLDCSGNDEVCRSGECVVVQRCGNSLDCVGAPDDKSICDATLGECVQCVAAEDCPPNNDCTARTCFPFTPCTNSLDCGARVCDTSSMRCVDCVRDADCGTGSVCRNNACETATCTPAPCGSRCGIVPNGCGNDIDCGACVTHCADGMQNADETGVDCGGADCAACTLAGVWERCLEDADCADGRICSKASQEAVLPGRFGFCTLPCAGNDAQCTDAAPPGSGPARCSLVQCAISCDTTPCPFDMECLAGTLFMTCRYELISSP